MTDVRESTEIERERGRRLREKRLAKNITQAELAKAAGTSAPNIGGYESANVALSEERFNEIMAVLDAIPARKEIGRAKTGGVSKTWRVAVSDKRAAKIVDGMTPVQRGAAFTGEPGELLAFLGRERQRQLAAELSGENRRAATYKTWLINVPTARHARFIDSLNMEERGKLLSRAFTLARR